MDLAYTVKGVKLRRMTQLLQGHQSPGQMPDLAVWWRLEGRLSGRAVHMGAVAVAQQGEQELPHQGASVVTVPIQLGSGTRIDTETAGNE